MILIPMTNSISIPTTLSPREVRLLTRVTESRRVVEAGALLGFSTIATACKASHVVSIDRHEGYSGSTWHPFLSNLHRFGVRDKVTPVKGDIKDVLPLYHGDIGVLDLTGTFEDTLQALALFQVPYLLIHDFQRVKCEGVERAIKAARLNIEEVVDTYAFCSRY